MVLINPFSSELIRNSRLRRTRVTLCTAYLRHLYRVPLNETTAIIMVGNQLIIIWLSLCCCILSVFTRLHVVMTQLGGNHLGKDDWEKQFYQTDELVFIFQLVFAGKRAKKRCKHGVITLVCFI